MKKKKSVGKSEEAKNSNRKIMNKSFFNFHYIYALIGFVIAFLLALILKSLQKNRASIFSRNEDISPNKYSNHFKNQ